MQPYSHDRINHLRITIGRKIYHLRCERRLSLRKLAMHAGLSVRKLDHYEIGKNEITLDQLLRIACAFGVEVEELVRQAIPLPLCRRREE